MSLTTVLEGINAGNAARGGEAGGDDQLPGGRGGRALPHQPRHGAGGHAVLGDAGKLANAAALLLTLPGAPFLYYGEELGLSNGGANNDESKRTPMPWNGRRAEASPRGRPGTPSLRPGDGERGGAGGNPGSLLSRYRALIRARQASEALSRGGLKLFTATTGCRAARVRAHAGRRAGAGGAQLLDHKVSVGPYDWRAPRRRSSSPTATSPRSRRPRAAGR